MPVPADFTRSLESRCYRMALWLCPPVFRREHGDEMSRDFDEAHDEARDEAATRGDRLTALWTLRLVMAIDLVRTAGVQWLRTGLPVIALVAVFVQFAIAVALAASVAIARSVTRPIPDTMPDAEVLGILFIAVGTVLLIGITIALNLWVTRLNRRRWRR